MRGGKVGLQFITLPGESYLLQASTNLVDWVTLRTVKANSDGVIDYEDPNSAAYPARYYRLTEP